MSARGLLFLPLLALAIVGMLAGGVLLFRSSTSERSAAAVATAEPVSAAPDPVYKPGATVCQSVLHRPSVKSERTFPAIYTKRVQANGLTIVSSHLPTADAPVGLVDVTVSWTLPDPAAPTLNVTVTTLKSWAAMRPIRGQVVMVTLPIPVQDLVNWASIVPLLVTVNCTVLPVALANRILGSGWVALSGPT